MCVFSFILKKIPKLPINQPTDLNIKNDLFLLQNYNKHITFSSLSFLEMWWWDVALLKEWGPKFIYLVVTPTHHVMKPISVWLNFGAAKSPVLGGFYCTDNNVNSMSIKLLTLKICLELQEQSCRPLFPTQTLFLNTQQFSISKKNKHSILSLLTYILITQTLF